MIEKLSADAKTWDLCVVGTGPVGMVMALEFERLGREVLVLESGGLQMDAATGAASKAEIVDPGRHAAMEIAVVRALGGTSWTWGGRCVAYDDIDWMPRAYVADAYWPVTHNAIRPYYKRATEYLLCGSDVFTVPYKRPVAHGLTLDGVERWASEARVVLRHREKILQSEHIKLGLNSTVTALDLSPDGTRVESLTVNTPDGIRTIKAKKFVLAMGCTHSNAGPAISVARMGRWAAITWGTSQERLRAYVLPILRRRMILISSWREAPTIAGGSC